MKVTDLSHVAGIFCLVRQGNVGAFEVSDIEEKDNFLFFQSFLHFTYIMIYPLFRFSAIFFLIFTCFILVFISMLSDDCQRRHHSPGRGNQSYCYCINCSHITRLMSSTL